MATGPLPRRAPAQTKPCYEIPELLLAWLFPAPDALAASRLLWASCLVWDLRGSSPSGTAQVLPRRVLGASSRGDALLWIPAELGCTSWAYLSQVFAVPWC